MKSMAFIMEIITGETIITRETTEIKTEEVQTDQVIVGSQIMNLRINQESISMSTLAS